MTPKLYLLAVIAYAVLVVAAYGSTHNAPEAQSSGIRKVILLQGIDTASRCNGRVDRSTSFAARRNAIVQALTPLGAKPEDVIEFSYSGSYEDCATKAALTVPDAAAGNATAAYTPDDTCNGVQKATQRLSDLIIALRARFPKPRFELVGHSMGGLVGTNYVSELKPEDRKLVQSVILLDSPVQGMPPPANPLSACTADDASWQNLLDGSDLTRDLKQVACRNRDIEFIAVLATTYIGDSLDCASTVHTQAFGQTPAPEANTEICGRLAPTLSPFCQTDLASALVTLMQAHGAVWLDPNALRAIAEGYATK